MNFVNSDGACLLSYAPVKGDLDEVNMLLEAGADPNVCDATGDTALMWAAHGNNPAVIRRLVEAGAVVNAQCADLGYTPLIWAVSSGSVKEVKLLLELGADPKLHDTWGQTALEKAAGKPEMAALLTKSQG